MDAFDMAQELARIGSTAGLSQDALDLLGRKALQLAEQIAALEQENTAVLRENRQLKSENENLKAQLQNARPNEGEISGQTAQVLKLFFDNPHSVSDPQIAKHLQISQMMVGYHTDILFKKELIACATIGFSAMGMGGRTYFAPTYAITAKGREYCINNGLAG